MNHSPAFVPRLRSARPLRVATVALALCGAIVARAQDDAPAYAPDPALLAQVESLARDGAGAPHGGQKPPVRVEVKLGQLDPRLRLAPCQHIEPYLPPGLPAWGATRMGLRCTQGSKRWNVSLPIIVSVFAPATVLRTPLAAGTVLDASMLDQAEVDLAAAPGAAVADPTLALGRTLSRNLAGGATLRQTDLKARQYFAAGETVRVVAIGPGWQVVTEGQAVNAGIEGQVARIRTDSGRILNTRPSGEHQVDMTL